MTDRDPQTTEADWSVWHDVASSFAPPIIPWDEHGPISSEKMVLLDILKELQAIRTLLEKS